MFCIISTKGKKKKTLQSPPKKALSLVSEVGKVAGNKVNIQKPMAHLYINNELSERETKKKISFTIATRKKSTQE